MLSISARRYVFVGLFCLVIVIIGIISLYLFTDGSQLISTIKNKYYSEILPKNTEIIISNQSVNYQVDPTPSDFAKNLVNEINLFEGPVILHHQTYTEKVNLRELEVIFVDEVQYWPGVSTQKSGNLSTFDFSIDETLKGTVKIWINPSIIGDQKRLSSVVNRTYFLALYKVKNWETYQIGENFNIFLDRVDSELDSVPIEERPIKVSN